MPSAQKFATKPAHSAYSQLSTQILMFWLIKTFGSFFGCANFLVAGSKRLFFIWRYLPILCFTAKNCQIVAGYRHIPRFTCKFQFFDETKLLFNYYIIKCNKLFDYLILRFTTILILKFACYVERRWRNKSATWTSNASYSVSLF